MVGLSIWDLRKNPRNPCKTEVFSNQSANSVYKIDEL
jgi:hypothetical protein